MLCYAKATTGSLCNYLNKRRKSNDIFTQNISNTNALCLGFVLFSAFPNKCSLLDSQRGEGESERRGYESEIGEDNH